MSLRDELRAVRAPEHRARAPRRWDLVLTGAVLLAPALVLAGVLAVRQRTGDPEARLVRDARELLSRRHPRPVHVDAPSPGAIGDAIPRHLPPLDAAAKELAKDEASCGMPSVNTTPGVPATPARGSSVLGAPGASRRDRARRRLAPSEPGGCVARPPGCG
jgi:hypothetical protein